MALTRAELANLASGAGFTGDDINIAVAVALAESGGNPTAHNTNAATGDNSYGLWQINMIGKLGPDRRRALGITNNEALFTPAVNAKAARMVWKSQGWKGWTTYTRGTYRTYYKADTLTLVREGLQNAGGVGRGVAQLLPGGSVPQAASGAAEAVNDAKDGMLSGVTGALTSIGANMVGLAIGVALLVLGVVLLLREPAGRAVKAVLPAGKAGKILKAVT